MREVWFAAGIGLLLSVFAASASAAEIYQWRDKAGIVHFTDDPMQVPAGQRAEAAREVTPLPLQRGAGISGKAAWKEKCALCHSPADSIGDKLGLGRVAWPTDALNPVGADSLTEQLRYAASGRYSDMDRVDTDDEELEAIARYLISAQK